MRDVNRSDFPENSALHALGALPEEDAAALESLAKADPELGAILRADADTVGELGKSCAAAPPPGLREKVLNRIREHSPSPALPEGLVALVRGGESRWRSTPYPGVTAKRLFSDKESGNATWLLKLDPGAVYPSHRHAVAEHCYVIEGDVVFANYALAQGDYGVAATGSHHAPFTTQNGCLLLIMNNDHDEVFH